MADKESFTRKPAIRATLVPHVDSGGYPSEEAEEKDSAEETEEGREAPQFPRTLLGISPEITSRIGKRIPARRASE